MDRNNNYLNPENIYKTIERASSWKSLMRPTSWTGLKYQDVGPTSSSRIIQHDAERIFLNPERRKILSKILSCYEHQFKDYHQGLSLTCGFLLLSLREQEVLDIITVLATEPKYIVNYWKAEPVEAARDAHVYEYMLEKHYPEIVAHLKLRRVSVEVFYAKWFIALTINVLPFQPLFNFFEFFLAQGYMYLFKFGLSLSSTYKSEILSGADYQILQIFRLEKELCKNRENFTDLSLCGVVDQAANFELMHFDISNLREIKIKPIIERLEKIKEEEKLQAEKKSESSDSDEDSGSCCDICENNVPDYWCLKCKKLICEKCHTENAGNHSKKHKVDSDWEKYEDPNYDND
jgi:hypothetical protein